MKRSKMVEHILNQLKENGYEFVSVSLVEDILFAAQVSGMAPPFVDELEGDSLDVIGRKWEPEDE